MSETLELKNCETHGDYQAKVFEGLGSKIYTKCPTCQEIEKKAGEEKTKQFEAFKAEQAARDAKNRMLANGLIPRYLGTALESFTPTDEQKAAYDVCLMFALKFDEMCASGKTLVFCGTVGTGKTMLVHALMQSVNHGCYIRAIDLSRRVRDCYSKNESEFDLINEFASVKLLVIDEIGVQQDTKHESLLITDLIDRRYGNLLPTIICSNLNKEKLRETFGERAWDRLMQNSTIVPILGKSQRVSENKNK